MPPPYDSVRDGNPKGRDGFSGSVAPAMTARPDSHNNTLQDVLCLLLCSFKIYNLYRNHTQIDGTKFIDVSESIVG